MGKHSGKHAPVNGVVLYKGRSLLDGQKIVVIVTGLVYRSKNEKTGDMLQSWILYEKDTPLNAIKLGLDVAVCGECRHRPALGGTCYVNVAQAPQAVYRAWQAGAYPRFNAKRHLPLFRGRLLRMGAYGDPCAVPLDVWLPLLVTVDGHSGYTHQWRTCEPDWRRFVMASCDTEQERLDARAQGWRTFRVRAEGTPLMAGEFSCPASEEAGKKRTCATCRACDGATDSPDGASPAIVVHGHTKNRFALTLI